MLTSHILDAIGNSDLSKEQQQQLIDLLLTIKDDTSLLSEFALTSARILNVSVKSAPV